MGRGRQKAKDAKIARQLKYSSPESDLAALERELVSGEEASAPQVSSAPDNDDVEEDRYDPWGDKI